MKVHKGKIAARTRANGQPVVDMDENQYMYEDSVVNEYEMLLSGHPIYYSPLARGGL